LLAPAPPPRPRCPSPPTATPRTGARGPAAPSRPDPARRCGQRWPCCPPAPERGVPAAVAVELVHNFSLLHDDIMDGDQERRHRPTAWTVYGIGAAIL